MTSSPDSVSSVGVVSRPSGGVARLIGSSEYRALSDDSLKDEDNAAWVLSLDPDDRRAWLDRIRSIRLADRLAENEVLEPQARRFARFRHGWVQLRDGGGIDPGGPFARELDAIRALWLCPACSAVGPQADTAPGRRMARLAGNAWSAYLDALAVYHAPEVVLPTLRDHDHMLWRLSGRIFQLMPFLTEGLWDAAGELGRLDQFFNNLRDMNEDAERGLCYLPDDVLGRFELTRGDIVSGRCFTRPGYLRMMRFWLDEHLPTLRARAAPFLLAPALHPSLQVMRAWSVRRYARTARVLRAVEFDFRRFPARYWAQVRRDLAERRRAAPGQPA